jgi:hypothetical protein
MIIRPGISKEMKLTTPMIWTRGIRWSLALAGFEKDPTHADFLRRYSLDRYRTIRNSANARPNSCASSIWHLC